MHTAAHSVARLIHGKKRGGRKVKISTGSKSPTNCRQLQRFAQTSKL